MRLRLPDTLALLLTLGALLPTGRAVAEGPAVPLEPAAGPWLPVIVGPADGIDLLPVIRDLGAALRETAQITLLHPTPAAVKFERLHPRLIEPSEEAVASAGTQIEALVQQTALAEWGPVGAGMGTLLLMPIAERDPILARLDKVGKVLGSCLALVAHLPSLDRASDIRQAAHCITMFPTAGADLKLATATVLALYQSALTDLLAQGAASLHIELAQESDGPCTVAINGHNRGPLPLHEPRLAPVPVRALITCAGESQIFRIELKPGENRLSVHPRLSEVLTTGGYLGLRYTGHDPGAIADASALASLMGAQASLLFARDPQDRLHVQTVTAAGQLTTTATIPLQPTQDDFVRVARTLTGTAQPLEHTAATTGPTDDLPSYFDTPVQRVAGIGLAALGLAGAIATWTYHDLRLQYRDAVEDDRPEFHPKYIADGKNAVLLASAGTALLAASTPLLLPAYEDASAIPWIAGGAGLAGAAVGLYLSAAGSPCTPTRCDEAFPDVMTGPLVLIQSAALLAIPTTYLVRELFGSQDLTADVSQAQGDGLHLQITARY